MIEKTKLLDIRPDNFRKVRLTIPQYWIYGLIFQYPVSGRISGQTLILTWFLFRFWTRVLSYILAHSWEISGMLWTLLLSRAHLFHSTIPLRKSICIIYLIFVLYIILYKKPVPLLDCEVLDFKIRVFFSIWTVTRTII